MAYKGLMDEFKQEELHKANRVAGTSQESQDLRTRSEEDNADCPFLLLNQSPGLGASFFCYLSFPK